MKYSNEKGQALVEMCAGIIGMLSLFVAILFVSGISISNIKTLQSSKMSAETTVLNASESYLIVRRDIEDWKYDNNIPFSAGDKERYKVFDLGNLVDDNLSNSGYSALPPGSFQSLPNIEMRSNRTPEVNFFLNSFDNYATAASLVEGNADSYDTLYSYRRQSTADRRALEEAIARWLGINVRTLNANRLRSNQAYMPNFGRNIPEQFYPATPEE